MTGDGRVDLIVAAGFTGGPRVTVWDGRGVGSAGGGRPTINPVANFFAFESTLRNGAFASAGDIDGDGKADLVFGAGPGGAPRVRIADAAKVMALGTFSLDDADAASATIVNFYAGDSTLRGGVRVAMRNEDRDAVADLVTGSGEGDQSEVRMYKGTSLRANPTNPALDQMYDPFGQTLPGGVYVG